jgi:hypothetical protein
MQAAPMAELSLERVNDEVWRVRDAGGLHVGNLKLIQSLWKFKAIGYDAQWDVIPGGGPLTDRHNTTFVSLVLADINARLSPGA